MEIITRRLADVIKDGKDPYFSLKVTLTSELLDLGIDEDKREKAIIVSLVNDNGKRKVVIEKNEAD